MQGYKQRESSRPCNIFGWGDSGIAPTKENVGRGLAPAGKGRMWSSAPTDSAERFSFICNRSVFAGDLGIAPTKENVGRGLAPAG